MDNTAKEIIKKYESFISNIKWHICVNAPINQTQEIECKIKLDCYNDIVKDLKAIEQYAEIKAKTHAETIEVLKEQIYLLKVKLKKV